MREDALGLLNSVQDNGLAYIFHRSKPKAVLLNIEEFALIQKIIEDYEDFMDVQQLKKEPIGKKVPLNVVMKKYV